MDNQDLIRAEQALIALSRGELHVDPARLWADQLDALLPADAISTNEVAKTRLIKTDGGGVVNYNPDLTQYLAAVNDAMDDPAIRVVALKGPARGGKTISAENYLLKVGIYGPSRNVLWYMHSGPDLRRYVEERVNFFLEEHVDLAAKRTPARKNEAWNLKSIDGQLWEWLAANKSTTRARSASLVVGDEIDGMVPAIRDAIVTLIKNRQKEYGSLAKMFVCSHPDAGPEFGIDAVLRDSDMRVRLWTCRECGYLMGPAEEVPPTRRMIWNVAELMQRGSIMPREELLPFIKEEVRIVCPNCRSKFTETERMTMRNEAEWFAKGQEIVNETIVGERVPVETAGFVIDAFDCPFDTLPEMASQWVAAKLDADANGKTHNLKEVVVKTLGRTFKGDESASKPRLWKELKAKLVDPSYKMGEVPPGVRFLTSFVDIGGSSFEVGVIGWSANRESWLIDRFSVLQRANLDKIKPGDNLEDWDAIEATVLNQTYPLMDGSGLHLGVAKGCIDTGGVPGVTNNARRWAANIHSREDNPVPSWRVSLQMGDAWKKGELYSRSRKITHDDAENELPVPVLERTINVFDMKKIIVARMMDIDAPGPGWMHLPSDVKDEHVRELCAETLVGEDWIRRGANELLDIYVGADVGRALLAPDDVAIDWDGDPPIYAVPFMPSHPGQRDDKEAPGGLFDQLAKFNKRRPGRS